MNGRSLLCCIAVVILAGSAAGRERLSGYVDPQIGTAHSRWFFYTPAAVPFGMAKPAPTTDGHLGNPSGWEAVGYDARHTSIEGFADFHEFQVGGLVLAPMAGKLMTVPGELSDPDSGYRSRFDKADESASPGYYKVFLKDYGIVAELTATDRVAFHRFTFDPSRGPAHIVFNVGTRMGESGRVTASDVVLTPDGRIEGSIITVPRYVENYQRGGSVKMYFSAVMNAEPSSVGTFVEGQVFPDRTSQEGVGAGLYVTFQDQAAHPKVEVKVGLSSTSVSNARLNLETEARRLDFDRARKKAERRWEENFRRIRVEGGLREDRVKFYTGLFHALLGRGLASDVNGAYPAHDGSIGQIPLGADGRPVHNHYNTDAIWGAFWNLTQLWTLAWPACYSDWISSQLLVYKDAGWLGDGIACSHYVSGVGTNFVGLAIAAAYNCGIRDFDVALGYEAARKDALESRDRPIGAGKLDIGPFVRQGWSPYLNVNEYYSGTDTLGSSFSVSHTLEYAFNSYAVAQMARALGHDEDAALLSTLSEGWKNVYDPTVKLVRPRLPDGSFLEDFDPHAAWIGFQEGNAIQYTYYVPHAPEELVAMVGPEEFNRRLDSSFLISRDNVFGGGKTVNAFAGLQAYYNHGNQPNLHISGLFNFSGKPFLSQKWMRLICNEFYGTEGVHGYGYGQDEDQGQLGAWYVLAAMGLFDVKGLTAPDPSFQVVSPLFDKITIRQDRRYGSGRKFVIETLGNGPESLYIHTLTLNGKPMDSIQLPLEAIRKGGKLVVGLGQEADESRTR